MRQCKCSNLLYLVNCECTAEWGGQRGLVECCEAGRLLATVESTCSSRDLSRDVPPDDGRQPGRDSDDVSRSCGVVRSVCCLAEHRQVRCRRGVSYAVSTWQQQQQQQHVDDYDCEHLSDNAKV